MALVGLFGCNNGDNELQETSLEVNVTAGSDESVVIKVAESETTLSVTITNIAESRCASDVVCVHAGWVIVDFQTEESSFSLKIGESKEFLSGDERYKLTLLDVTPYPTTQNSEEDRKAVFVVEAI